MKLNKNRFILLTPYSRYVVYAHIYIHKKRGEIYRYFLCKAINNISIYTCTWHKIALHFRNFTTSLKKNEPSKLTKGTEQRQSQINSELSNLWH